MTTEQLKELNSHYCLATKEHYDKLVEDGIPLNAHLLAGKPLSFKYLLVRQTITGFDEIPKAYQDKPMHLHNNEWIMGSLEHEDLKVETRTCGDCANFNEAPFNGFPTCKEKLMAVTKDMLITYKDTSCFKPKSVERITREVVTFNGIIQHDYNTGKDLVLLPSGRSKGDDMYPFGTTVKVTIEYLEANQKEK